MIVIAWHLVNLNLAINVTMKVSKINIIIVFVHAPHQRERKIVMALLGLSKHNVKQKI